jgi:hypothetical protein
VSSTGTLSEKIYQAITDSISSGKSDFHMMASLNYHEKAYKFAESSKGNKQLINSSMTCKIIYTYSLVRKWISRIINPSTVISLEWK